MVLNTIVAEELSQFADILEEEEDFTAALNTLLKDTIKNHKRIIFNGNNYTAEWVEEAEKRGLLNLKSTPESLPYFTSEKNIKLFEKFDILTEKEINSRTEIVLEEYIKELSIEALTFAEIAKKDIIPAVVSYIKELSDTANSKMVFVPDADSGAEKEIILKLSLLMHSLYSKTELLESRLLEIKNCIDVAERAIFSRAYIFSAMQELRAVVDEIETNTAKKYWPFPTYGDLLFSV